MRSSPKFAKEQKKLAIKRNAEAPGIAGIIWYADDAVDVDEGDKGELESGPPGPVRRGRRVIGDKPGRQAGSEHGRTRSLTSAGFTDFIALDTALKACFSVFLIR
jgi:hypothetical protein